MDREDTVRVDVEGDLDLRHAARRRHDPLEVELPERAVVAGLGALALEDVNLDGRLVEKLYAQCATFYDQLCGPILQAGRREAMHELRLRPNQTVLEVGIGTALTAPLYPRDCRVTGIDLSAPMLREALKHVDSPGAPNIQLLQMDASKLAFADQSFDVVYAAYVLSH